MRIKDVNMLKKNFWLNVFAVAALSFTSIASYAGAQELKSAALGDLLDNSSYTNLVELPVPAEVAAPEKAAGLAPQPGKDFTPVIKDQARIKAIMKLVSDVYNGKPLPYSQDGTTFKNKEGKLPAQPAGFYKEYTLLTGNAPHTVVIGGTTYQVAPDLSARGSERVIIGGGQKIYYTPDHYAHFILLEVVY
ncbi:MAG: hypothetical protein A2X31_03555 [Elusimicrobia bacterium GWB2_63_22]|nr:MAG: hypothetical protein A2X31_03555 [Elusimicrobia bacterium GWB2_63_22]